MYETLAGKMQIRPIERWPGELTPDSRRRRSPFSADWRTTMGQLNTELYNLGAEAVVLQVAMREEDFRLDGLPRASARADHPGVILSFNPDGQAAERMQFATDVFWTWQENVRAIALGLEALRKVDRYGITRGRSQYAGFRQLPSGAFDASYGLHTADEAYEWLLREFAEEREAISRQGIVKRALMSAHPDKGGDTDTFQKVMRAKELIGA